jgi:hypothetical protein
MASTHEASGPLAHSITQPDGWLNRQIDPPRLALRPDGVADLFASGLHDFRPSAEPLVENQGLGSSNLSGHPNQLDACRYRSRCSPNVVKT